MATFVALDELDDLPALEVDGGDEHEPAPTGIRPPGRVERAERTARRPIEWHRRPPGARKRLRHWIPESAARVITRTPLC